MASKIPPPAGCRMGRAQEVITPGLPVPLAGYFHDRVAKTVRDDLFAKAVVIESNGARMALVSCDLVTLTAEVVNAAKTAIEERTGIPPSHVLVCASHTHTGPEVRHNAVVPVSEPWLETLPGRIADAVVHAADSLVNANLRIGAIEAAGYNFNRVFRCKDGSEVFGRMPDLEDVIGPAGPTDPQLQTLSATDPEGKLLALVVNFAMHPDVIGGGTADFVSADWPGEVAKNISAVYGEDVVTVFLQGTCGDLNQSPYEPTNLPVGGEAKAEQLGRGLAGAAMMAHERAEPMHVVSPISARIEELAIPYYTRDEKFYAEVEELKRRKERTYFEQAFLERAESWSLDGETASAPVQAMRIGDVAIVALPAEIFVGIGLDIKRWSPAAATMVVELANGRASGYVPTTDQAERGAYGAKPVLSRWLCSDAGRRMTEAAQVMLHKMWA